MPVGEEGVCDEQAGAPVGQGVVDCEDQRGAGGVVLDYGVKGRVAGTADANLLQPLGSGEPRGFIRDVFVDDDAGTVGSAPAWPLLCVEMHDGEYEMPMGVGQQMALGTMHNLLAWPPHILPQGALLALPQGVFVILLPGAL
jgi:hypothetical protein